MPLKINPKGFAGARTIAIAEKAGVTHAMLHYYFRKKEQLFERVITKNAALLAQTMIAAMDNPDMPIVERLKSGIASHLDFIAANPQLPRFFLNEVLSRPELYHLFYAKISEVGKTLFADLQVPTERTLPPLVPKKIFFRISAKHRCITMIIQNDRYVWIFLLCRSVWAT